MPNKYYVASGVLFVIGAVGFGALAILVVRDVEVIANRKRGR